MILSPVYVCSTVRTRRQRLQVPFLGTGHTIIMLDGFLLGILFTGVICMYQADGRTTITLTDRMLN